MGIKPASLGTSTAKALGLAAVIVLLAPSGLEAAIAVEPVVLDITAPAAAGAFRLRNNDPTEVAVQTRVFRWVQSQGKESLVPSTDVAASPPIVSLQPGSDYTVRVVRTSDRPISGEESYRVLVDELPPLRRALDNTVSILVRQSIPVFFRAQGLTRANVTWSYSFENGQVEVFARNDGDSRMRIASLRLVDHSGKEVSFGNGLIGYVLGHSSMTFTKRATARDATLVGPLTIECDTSLGQIQASAARHVQP